MLFAYGTLRPGCGNDRLLGEHRQVVGDAVLLGYALHHHECMAYPVLIPGGGLTHGTLYEVFDRDLTDVVMMEVLAGYEARWLRVQVDRGNGDEFTEALTFTWPRPYYGPRIDSGDWTTTPHSR